MKILITGGAGFIGSNLCIFLLSKGHEIIIIDDLSTGKESNLSEVIEEIEFHNEKIELFNLDSLIGVGAVVHLAAQPSVPLSIKKFSESSSANLLGTINIIDFCRMKKIPFVYASSSAIYGDLQIGNDESKEVNLLSPYATDKYTMELYAQMSHKLYGLSSVGLRFFNVYGPRQDPSSSYSGVISIFSDRIIDGKDININGGYQTRDFVYVKDVVQVIYYAVVFALANNTCEVCNVLSGKSISIDNLANQMMKIIGIKVNKIYQDLAKGDPENSNGKVEKMIRLFSVETNQFYSLKDGLYETMQYIKNNQ
jgi:UDP-glucose 4-epimerase